MTEDEVYYGLKSLIKKVGARFYTVTIFPLCRQYMAE